MPRRSSDSFHFKKEPAEHRIQFKTLKLTKLENMQSDYRTITMLCVYVSGCASET